MRDVSVTVPPFASNVTVKMAWYIISRDALQS